MFKKILLFMVLCLSFATICFSQSKSECDIQLTKDISGKMTHDEVDELHDFFSSLFRDYNEYPEQDTVQYLYVYYVKMDDSIPFNCKMYHLRKDASNPFDCGMFKDGSFLDHIVPEYNSYVSYRKYFRDDNVYKKSTGKWLKSDVFVYDKHCRLISVFMYGELGEPHLDDLEYLLSKKIKEFNIVSLYRLQCTNNMYYIGIAEDRRVYFVRVGWNDVYVYPASEFKDDEFPYMFEDGDDLHRSLWWDCAEESE